MQTTLIRRQYDEVIAGHYDLDPQSVIGDSLDRATGQLSRHQLLPAGTSSKVLDLGMGTGRFFEKLQRFAGEVQPFGIDLSPRMIDVARTRLPDLVAAVDDAANLDAHFSAESFDLVATHFLTGFVPLSVLAPKIHSRLAEDGYWSLVAGTKAGFPILQKTANSRAARWLFGGRGLEVDERVCNPADENEVVRTLRGHGFSLVECETFTPGLTFANLDAFMEFAYYGGWLTPFIEGLGLHQAGKLFRAVLNQLFFPLQDQHNIVIALAQKQLTP